jgi:hypothetical protein
MLVASVVRRFVVKFKDREGRDLERTDSSDRWRYARTATSGRPPLDDPAFPSGQRSVVAAPESSRPGWLNDGRHGRLRRFWVDRWAA